MTSTARLRTYRERLLDIIEEQAAEAARLADLAHTAAEPTHRELLADARFARALALAAATALLTEDLPQMRRVLSHSDQAARAFLSAVA